MKFITMGCLVGAIYAVIWSAFRHFGGENMATIFLIVTFFSEMARLRHEVIKKRDGL